MRTDKIMKWESELLFIIILYCSASLFHFMHNAIYIDEYPDLSGGVSAIGVSIAWIGFTCIGLVSYVLIHRDKRFIVPILLVAYGALEFDGMGHYSLEPISSHTYMLNVAIWFEAIAALVSLVILTGLTINYFKGRSEKVFD